MKICFFLGKQVDVSKETGGNMALPITRTEEGEASMLRSVEILVIAGYLLLLPFPLLFLLYLYIHYPFYYLVLVVILDIIYLYFPFDLLLL